MININDYIKDFNPIKDNPTEKRTQEMCKSLLTQINKTIKDIYEKEYNKTISNYPTDDMIKFTSTNEISTLNMSNVLSFIYDEESECLILSDILYDEHQKSIDTDEFNSLLLWTRIFSKQNMIRLEEHNKEKKYLSYKVIDKQMISNIIDYNNKDLKDIKDLLSKIDLDETTQKIIDKYSDKNLKNKSEKEIISMSEKDCYDLLQNTMIQISSILQKVNKND